MANKKMTIVEKYEAIIEKAKSVLSDEEVQFLQERADLVAKKNSNRKPSAAQTKNKAVADAVLEFLRTTGKKMQIKQMLKEIPAFAEIDNCTPQYAMAIIRPMKQAGIISRVEEKGVAYFYATEVEGE